MSDTSVAHHGYTTEDRDDGAIWYRVGEELINVVAATKPTRGYESSIEDAWHVTLFDPFTSEATWAIVHGRDYAEKLCALHARTAARAVTS